MVPRGSCRDGRGEPFRWAGSRTRRAMSARRRISSILAIAASCSILVGISDLS
jgi:hypothetical protein